MRWFSQHPRADDLVAFSRDRLDAPTRTRVSAHARACVHCQRSLRVLMALRDASAPAPDAPDFILERALASRAAGERYILPAAAESAVRVHPRARLLAASAAAVVVATIGAFALLPGSVEAVGSSSMLTMVPARPHARDTIRVSYRPGAGLFADEDTLVLRASLRVPGDRSYPAAVPRTRVRPVAMLIRGKGGEFTASFVLPDSVVYASLVVENRDVSRIDRDGGHAWELFVHDSKGQPTYESLDQRTHDMMGQSWEEGYATAKRLTVLYPDRVGSWAWRRNFDSWLLGPQAADSVNKSFAKRLDALIRRAKSWDRLSEGDAETIFFESMVRARRGNAADSAEFRYWLERVTREYPHHPQLGQYYAFNFSPAEYRKPAFMLDSLEHLYANLQPLSGHARSLLTVALQASTRANDDSAYARWAGRLYAHSPEDLALALAERPAFRLVAMESIRSLLAANNDSSISRRGLMETAAQYRLRLDDGRSKLLAALGRALVAEGGVAAGLDTLNLAARGTWDVSLFRSLRAVYRTAGDSAGVMAMNARVSVDPRTNVDTASRLAAAGRLQVGAQHWDSLVGFARGEMLGRLLARAIESPLRKAPTLVDSTGKTMTLRSLSAGAPVAIIIWSRNCGAAIDRLPEIAKTFARLSAQGKRVLFVADEAPSSGVREVLAKYAWKFPVYYDARGEVTTALASFGTPGFYVLDAAGHMRFNFAEESADVIAQMDAVASEGSRPSSTR